LVWQAGQHQGKNGSLSSCADRPALQCLISQRSGSSTGFEVCSLCRCSALRTSESCFEHCQHCHLDSAVGLITHEECRTEQSYSGIRKYSDWNDFLGL
jgi:hypothetical protein